MKVNLRSVMKNKGHTQRSLSDGTGIPVASIFRYCDGAPAPIDRAYAIAKFLRADIRKIWVFDQEAFSEQMKEKSISKKLGDIFG